MRIFGLCIILLGLTGEGLAMTDPTALRSRSRSRSRSATAPEPEPDAGGDQGGAAGCGRPRAIGRDGERTDLRDGLGGEDEGVDQQGMV
jgi:hypothetical protein